MQKRKTLKKTRGKCDYKIIKLPHVVHVQVQLEEFSIGIYPYSVPKGV